MGLSIFSEIFMAHQNIEPPSYNFRSWSQNMEFGWTEANTVCKPVCYGDLTVLHTKSDSSKYDITIIKPSITFRYKSVFPLLEGLTSANCGIFPNSHSELLALVSSIWLAHEFRFDRHCLANLIHSTSPSSFAICSGAGSWPLNSFGRVVTMRYAPTPMGLFDSLNAYSTMVLFLIYTG